VDSLLDALGVLLVLGLALVPMAAGLAAVFLPNRPDRSCPACGGAETMVRLDPADPAAGGICRVCGHRAPERFLPRRDFDEPPVRV
jgi:hypothetical protein